MDHTSPTQPDESRVSTALAVLNSTANNLRSRLDNLRDQLSTVVIPESPEQSVAETDVCGPQCELEDRIVGVTTTVTSCTTIVDSLLARLHI